MRLLSAKLFVNTTCESCACFWAMRFQFLCYWLVLKIKLAKFASNTKPLVDIGVLARRLRGFRIVPNNQTPL